MHGHRMVNFWFRYATTVFVVNYNVEYFDPICKRFEALIGTRRPIRVESVLTREAEIFKFQQTLVYLHDKHENIDFSLDNGTRSEHVVLKRKIKVLFRMRQLAIKLITCICVLSNNGFMFSTNRVCISDEKLSST